MAALIDTGTVNGTSLQRVAHTQCRRPYFSMMPIAKRYRSRAPVSKYEIHYAFPYSLARRLAPPKYSQNIVFYS